MGAAWFFRSLHIHGMACCHLIPFDETGFPTVLFLGRPTSPVGGRVSSFGCRVSAQPWPPELGASFQIVLWTTDLEDNWVAHRLPLLSLSQSHFGLGKECVRLECVCVFTAVFSLFAPDSHLFVVVNSGAKALVSAESSRS